MIQTLIDSFVSVQGWLLDTLVQPLLLALGMGSYVETAFDGVEFFLLGVLQLSAAYLLLRPLEALRPIEVWADRKLVRLDVLYSFLDRLGIIPLAVFVLLAPIFGEIDSQMRFHNIIPPQLEDWLPVLENQPLVSFFIYLVLIDFAQYWQHRLSHTLRWWWALHAIHHTQTQMSLWTDSRNHLLDNLIGGAMFAIIALLVGVPPGHFVGLIIAAQLVENLSHVNARLRFGRIGEELLVSPGYHRWHHALQLPAGEKYRYGCNFAILFPIWDKLFGTQYHSDVMPATGLPHEAQSDAVAAHGFWQQQRDGIVDLLATLRSGKRS